MKRLIVSADDFGFTEGVNQAILECYKKGSVSNASLAVNMDATENAILLAKQNPGLGVGLHFNLTLGKPLTDPKLIPSLVNCNGLFYNRKEFENRSIFGLIRYKDVEKELLAQIKYYLNFNLTMTHIDSHQHIHLLPPLFTVISNYCIQNSIPLRIPYNNYILNIQIPQLKDLTKLLRRSLLTLLIYFNRSQIFNKCLISNDHFYCIADFIPHQKLINIEHYIKIIDSLKSGVSELMTHPAIADDNLRKLNRISEISQQEYNVLSSFSLKSECQKRGVEFISYGNLS